MASVSRAWFVDKYGGPERLILRERPDPVPAPGEVLVRGAAIGLNFADLFVRSGDYPRTPKAPFVPGMELSGTIEALGPGVTGFTPGQRVVAVPLFGGHAEKVSVPVSRVFPLPDGVDLTEAAAVAVVFITAWYLCARAEVAAQERVVVTAAAGGVGTALLQLLAIREARTLALVGSEGKRALCRSLGAAETGLYEDAAALVASAFGGEADVVADAIGGRLFGRLWKRLGPGGRYVLYGFAAASGASGVAKLTAARELLAMGFLSPYSVVQSCRTLIGFNLSLLPDRTGELRRAAGEVFSLWKRGRIRPIVGPHFPFERLPEAHRTLAGRGTMGKVVVTLA
ncbi:MAG TPA: zinc-binding dehydrogenase [Thermoanaerobaculia bacterium]|jgi:NADPH2:quinone reductase